MARKTIFCIIATVISLFSWNTGKACTNIIVTKGASIDGSCMISYAADSHWLYGELYFHPEADWNKGAMIKINEWDTGRYIGEIPQAEHTYKTVGNMNEHQLIIAETTFGGRPELVDKNGGIDYGSLIYITLQRAKTAREAIKVLTDLANEYGYCSGGESFSIADKEEAWVMDLIGKGSRMENGVNLDKGVVWVARRIPDGYICAHANQSRITTFPFNDPENCMYSKDVVAFARRKGYFTGEDRNFDFSKAYAPYDFGTVRACDARVWSAFNMLCNGWFSFVNDSGNFVTRDAYDYVDYAMGYDMDNRMPLFVKPNRKVGVKNVADAMRDHYEGTPMDMTADIGAGGNALPYRWRPMGFEYDGKQYLNERAIATQQTGFWFVGQARGYYPDVIGGILWFGTDDAATSYLTPIYTCSTRIPECFAEGNGDLLTYSATSSFWINNRVSNACYKMYNQMAPFVRKRIDDFENNMMILGIREADKKAIDIYNEVAVRIQKKLKKAEHSTVMIEADMFKDVKECLTNFSLETADKQFKEWVALEQTLLIKFIDGNVKAQNQDGTFKHSDFSTHIPGGLTQPGYTEKWKEAVANDHGSVIKVLK